MITYVQEIIYVVVSPHITIVRVNLELERGLVS